MDTIIGERLTKLAKLVESEDDSEQDEMKDLLAKVPCNMVTIIIMFIIMSLKNLQYSYFLVEHNQHRQWRDPVTKSGPTRASCQGQLALGGWCGSWARVAG